MIIKNKMLLRYVSRMISEVKNGFTIDEASKILNFDV
jgi:hypothetical protein